MKNKFAATVIGVFTGTVALLVGAQALVSAKENDADRNLQGTWYTTVTIVNCDTGAPTPAVFPGILTFNKGETMSGTSTVAPSVFGVWSRTGGWENYAFAFTNFRYSSTGVFIGSQVVRQTVTLGASGNEFVSSGTVEFLDTSGNKNGAGCAKATGVRFE